MQLTILGATLSVKVLGNKGVSIVGKETLSVNETFYSVSSFIQFSNSNTLSKLTTNSWIYSRDNLSTMKECVIYIKFWWIFYYSVVKDYVKFKNASNIMLKTTIKIQRRLKETRAKKEIIATIFRIQGYNLTICGYFCKVFINFY